MSTSYRPRTAATGVRAATTLALWAAAWRGGASADGVLDALGRTGIRAGVRAGSTDAAERSGLPGPGLASAAAVDLLGLLRRGGPPALVLPVPGDLRGLPPGGDVVLPALDAGAVVVLPDAGVALVPVDGHWRALECSPAHATLTLAEATWLVDEAVTEATRALASADLASSRGNPREAVRRAILDRAVDTPAGMPSGASSLLAKATTLDALLTVAAGHETAAVTSAQLATVDDALAPLRSAVREARRTAVATTVAALDAAAGTPGEDRVTPRR